MLYLLTLGSPKTSKIILSYTFMLYLINAPFYYFSLFFFNKLMEEHVTEAKR